jgi:hypothetical protein
MTNMAKKDTLTKKGNLKNELLIAEELLYNKNYKGFNELIKKLKAENKTKEKKEFEKKHNFK